MASKRISASTRAFLARTRVKALSGGSRDVLSDLEANLSTATADGDRLALLLLKAELLFLDGAFAKSIGVFDEEIQPHFRLKPEEEITVLENRNEAARFIHEAGANRDFYHLSDIRRVFKLPALDEATLLHAIRSSAERRNFDSFPAFFGQLHRAHLGGSWKARNQAFRYFGWECLKLGLWRQALYCGLMALDKDLVETVAREAAALRQSWLIKDLLDYILKSSALSAHLQLRCRFLLTIADAIPEESTVSVIETTSAILKREPKWRPHPFTARELALKLLAAVASRCTPESAYSIVAAITSEPDWTEDRGLEDTLTVLKGYAPCLSEPTLSALAGQVTAYCNSDDSPQKVAAIDLIAAIAQRGSAALREETAKRLLDSGLPISWHLIGVLSAFGRRLPDTELDRLTDRVAGLVGSQVAVTDENVVPPSIGGFMSTTFVQGGKRTTVTMGGGLFELRSLLANFSHLSKEQCRKLIQAILRAAEQPANVMSNRIALVSCLIHLLEGKFDADDEIYAIAKRVLFPLSQGEITEPPFARHGDAQNPLNPFKIDLGDPVDLQGQALVALSVILNSRDADADRVMQLVEAILVSSNPKLRRYGIFSAEALLLRHETLLTTILIATRDPDAGVAAAAFNVLSRSKALDLISRNWDSLIYSARLASSSPNTVLRRAAARLLVSMRKTAGSTLPSSQLEDALTIFSEDVCFSVRKEMASIIREEAGL